MPLNDLIVEAFRLDLAAKLFIAILIGGGIGLERELKNKPAGLRTNILICLGSALLMDLSMGIAATHGGDPGRIAAQVVTGIGFLGAGTILHTRGQITGLTSAATIWVVAALGLAEKKYLPHDDDRPNTPLAPAPVAAVDEGRRATDRRGRPQRFTDDHPVVPNDQTRKD
jgi:hypothetical protein